MKMSSVKCRLFRLGLSAWLVDMIYVKRRFVLYRSRTRMKLRSSIRNYSVEAFYNDVPECVGMKTSCKTREIHSFSMTFSSDDFLRAESDEHISDCGLLSVLCPIAQGTNLWYSTIYSPTLHTQRFNPSWSENLCVQVPIAYMHPLRA